jgi:DNA-binding MarR family transcriptional regulator
VNLRSRLGWALALLSPLRGRSQVLEITQCLHTGLISAAATRLFLVFGIPEALRQGVGPRDIFCVILYVYTSIGDMDRFSLPSLDCMCGGFRRSTRALTQLYEQTFRPLGLRASQFTILQVLSRAGEVSQGQLGDILAMDSTTLTRTLMIMRQQGWITERRGEDRRERRLRLARDGEALLERAAPEWKKVQARLRSELGERTWENLARLSDRVTRVALKQAES